jgi:peroxiredoxin
VLSRLAPVARLAIVAVFMCAVGAPAQGLRGPTFGQITVVGHAWAAETAPGFRVKVLDAPREVDTRDLIGKRVLVLRFQTSYCKPCNRESAALDRVAARYRDRGVEVLALHVQDTVADTRRFIKRNQVRYAVALDPRLTIGNRFGLKGTPYTVVVDRKGEMIAQLHGVSVVGRLPKILDEALDK